LSGGSARPQHNSQPASQPARQPAKQAGKQQSARNAAPITRPMARSRHQQQVHNPHQRLRARPARLPVRRRLCAAPPGAD
jgi:hypothetical protein